MLDPQNDPHAIKSLVSASHTSSYVAAPISPKDRVVGFIHADRGISGDAVDALDRDTLWAFAEGFGYVLERTVLRHRLRKQRRRITDVARATENIDIQMVRDQSSQGVRSSDAAAALVDAQTRDGGLTAREREVFELLTTGATNTEVASLLAISPGTAKSHVKSILRKLGASNRAEAVSRYLRLSRHAEPAGKSPPDRFADIAV